MKKKILALFITLIMVFGLVAACDSPAEAPAAQEPVTPAEPAPAPAPAPEPVEAETAEPVDYEDDVTFSYPMDAQDVTLSFFLFGGPRLHSTIASWEDSPFHSGLNKHVGVNIEWMEPPAGMESELSHLNLMIAGGDMPDIIFSHHTMSQAELLIADGVILDLTPYIQEHAPAYYAFLQADSRRDRAFRTDSGQYYGFGFFREAGGWNDTFQGPLIRQDWLDELGLPSPKTISDWDTTLRAFNKEYGATFIAPWHRWQSMGADRTSNICGAFGAYGGTAFRIHIRDGKAIIPQLEPEWLDYITQLSIWWNDGLINQNMLSADDAMVRSMALNNEIGMAYSSMGQLSGWVNDALAEDTGSNWVGLQYPTGDDGTLVAVMGGTGIGGAATHISAKINPDLIPIAMRILDYAYTPEGFLYWNFGTEGVSWNMENGVPTFSDLLHNDPDGIHGAMEKYVGSVWNGPTIQATQVLIQRNNPASIEANNTWYYPNAEVAEKWNLPRGMALNVQEQIREGEIRGALATYIEEMAIRFMTGAEPLSNFDNFVSTARGMGVDELLSLYQAAYDRFMAR